MGKRRGGNHRELKGIAAGAIGGLVGSLLMNQATKLTRSFTEAREKERIALEGQQGGEHNYPENYGQQQPEGGNATEIAAEKISENVLQRELSGKQKKIGGSLVHYLFGTAVGAAYGAAAERLPVNKAVGLPFGAVVWLGADEIGVPAAGLSKPSTEYPASVHLNALAGHLVYGITTEVVRRGLRNLI